MSENAETVTKTSSVIAVPNLRVAWVLTVVVVLMAVAASAGGLLLPGLYREPPAVAATIRAQDAVTLLVVVVLAVTFVVARRGSTRATLVWVGLLGYVLYTYTGAAFAYTFNEFFLLYVSLFATSLFALIALVAGLDAGEARRRFDDAEPRCPVVLFLGLMALVLGVGELGQVLAFFATGVPPELISGTGVSPNFVFALDLGIVVPLAALAAVWLWRRRSVGYVLSAAMLILAATMGLALLAMTWSGVVAGLPLDVGLTVLWVLIAGGGIGLSVWFLRHCWG